VYDTGGNIQNRFEYAYTLDELELDMGIEPMVPPLDTVYYGYMEGTDVLIRYDGKRIESSLTGIYNYDGWTYMTDHGTRLMEMWNDETGEERYFTYNADGMRTKRTEPNGTTYHYVYNGGSLSQMTVGSNTLYFTYDANGAPLTVTYNGTTYYYATNLQGDVTAILNNAGTAVVSYTYDAWGNILDTAGTMKDTLGTLNPLRYRGYVYDVETNLYYLQSRYYNPAWGRFISADAYISTGQGVLGHNMFAYCLNNPVIYADPTGNCAIFAKIKAVLNNLQQLIKRLLSLLSTEPAVPQKDYDDFLDDLAKSESSGNHAIVNPYGFQGLYQMGSAALQDAGFMNSAGEWTALANSYGVYSKETYLSNPAAQKVAVTNFHTKVCGYIRYYGLDKYIGTIYQGVTVTPSGLVASCHLVGTWNMVDALKTGVVVTDGNGVPASYYMLIFADYNMAAVWGG